MNNTRTALYYPEIDIPSKRFIRKTILYWDEIGTIIPKHIWDEHSNFGLQDQDTSLLKKEGLYRPFFPHYLRSHGSDDLETRFQNEFYKRLDFFNQRDNLRHNTGYTVIYEEKEMIPGFFEKLTEPEYGLAKWQHNGISVAQFDHPVFFIESVTANIYMSILAEFLAEEDKNITTPVTENSKWQDFTYSTLDPDSKTVCANLILDGILPIPSDNVPLDKILRFKKDHKTELIRFRKSIDDFQSSITGAGSVRVVKDSCNQFIEEFNSGVIDIEQSLNDRNIDTVFGSLQTILDVKAPEISAALLSTGAIALGVLNPIFLLNGVVLNAAVKVERYLLKERHERRKWLENQPYSYVYHLQNSGIVQY